MAAPKVKTVTEREMVLATVARLDRRGHTQFGIRDELQRELGVDVSQPMISMYLKQIRQRYKEQQLVERRVKVNEKIEQLRDIRREAWTAWERSSSDAEKVVQEFATESEQAGIDDFVTSERLVKRIETREGRLPDNAYLQTIRATLKDERELLGLDEEKPVVNNNLNVIVTGAEFWQGLAKQVAAAMPVVVESRVVQAIETEVTDVVVERRDGQGAAGVVGD